MPGDAGERRTDQLSERCIQLLSTEFTIDTNCEAVWHRIRQVAPFPRQSVPVLQRRRFSVHEVEGEFRIDVENEPADFELTAHFAAENLLRRMHRDALAALPDPVRLRAAVGRSGDRAFLVVGPPRSGKTTLAVGLMLEGLDMACDELALLHGGRVTAFPWRFRVNEPAVALLPPLRSLSAVVARNGTLAPDWWFPVDPTDFGKPWQIEPAVVSAIFYLEPNHGARNEVVEAGKLDMTTRVLPQATAPPSGRRWIGDLTRLVNETRSYIVRVGDPAGAAVAVKRRL